MTREKKRIKKLLNEYMRDQQIQQTYADDKATQPICNNVNNHFIIMRLTNLCICRKCNPDRTVMLANESYLKFKPRLTLICAPKINNVVLVRPTVASALLIMISCKFP